MENDIKYIGHGKLKSILNDTSCADYQPHGLYIACDPLTGCYTALYNKDGQGWVEDFDTRYRAVRWLHGGVAKNIYGEFVRLSNYADECKNKPKKKTEEEYGEF